MNFKFALPFISAIAIALSACDSSSTSANDNGENGGSSAADSGNSDCIDNAVQCPATLDENSICDARDGKVYKTVVIGNQTWMAENMRYVACGSVGKSWCYNNEDANCEAYGRLYTWTAAMNIDASYQKKEHGALANLRGNCPEGFHMPSAADWNEMEAYADSISNGYPGPALRSTDVAWANQNVGAEPTNLTGFNVLPAGHYYFSRFELLGEKAYLWLAVEDTLTIGNMAPDGRHAMISSLSGFGKTVGFGNSSKDDGLSVRCVKD